MVLKLPDDLEPLPEINIVPMIDVTFAVMAFLIMSSLFLTRAEQLGVNLPEANSATASLQSQVIVSLDPQGQVALDGAPVDQDDLIGAVSNQVTTLNAQGIQPTVIVSADENVSHGSVVRLMDQLQTVDGIGGLAIATEPTKEPPSPSNSD